MLSPLADSNVSRLTTTSDGNLLYSFECLLLQDEQDDDDVDMTPIAFTSTGKAPPPCAGCLDGKSFAFSGDFTSLSREDAIHLVKSCGGSVSNSVSKATKYLVVGTTLPNGDNVSASVKYKDAIAKNVRILQQNQFFNLVSEASAQKQKEMLEKEKHLMKVKAEPTGSSSNGKQRLNAAEYVVITILRYRWCLRPCANSFPCGPLSLQF